MNRPAVTSGDWRDREAAAVLATGWLRVRIDPVTGWVHWDRLADVHAFRMALARAGRRSARPPMSDYDALLLFVSELGLGLEYQEPAELNL